MRSRRSAFESVCRIGAFAALGWMLGASVFPSRALRVERATGADVAGRLAAWTREGGAGRGGLGTVFHVDLAAAPSVRTSDWLGALRRSGRVVTWSGAPAALALSAEPVAGPRAGVRVEVAAPRGARIALRDSASAIDSAQVADLGVSVTAPIAVGALRAIVAGETAAVAVPAPARARAVAVVGAASWEGKFIAAALEESGWPVLARFTVAPRVDVVSAGDPLALDTSRVAAIVAIDSTIDAYGGAIERFVRMGGGLVLAGAAGGAPAVAALAPGTLGARTHPSVGPADTMRLGSTGFYPVAALRDDGVVLARQAARVAIAGRRVGAGRVVEVGYDDSWRWRMAGAPGSEAAHRGWWSRIVDAVAYAPSSPAADDAAASAPVAELANQLGPARAFPAAGAGQAIDPRILISIIMILLLAEWASRRLRGRR